MGIGPPFGPKVIESGPIPLSFVKVTVLLSVAFLETVQVTVLSVVVDDLGGISGSWSSLASYTSTEINATSSLPPRLVPFGSVELERSSTWVEWYPDAPPPPKPRYSMYCEEVDEQPSLFGKE